MQEWCGLRTKPISENHQCQNLVFYPIKFLTQSIFIRSEGWQITFPCLHKFSKLMFWFPASNISITYPYTFRNILYWIHNANRLNRERKRTLFGCFQWGNLMYTPNRHVCIYVGLISLRRYVILICKIVTFSKQIYTEDNNFILQNSDIIKKTLHTRLHLIPYSKKCLCLSSGN